MANLVKYPFVRSINFAGGYNLYSSPAVRLVQDDMLFEASAPAGNDIFGSTSLTFTNSGTLTGRGNIAGTAGLTFTNTATLTGRGNIAGATSLVFTNAGTVTGRGNVAGATTLTFTNAGAVSGIGSISGATGITFANAGVLTGIGNIAGATSITFALTGTLVDAANNDIFGSTSITFTNSGTLENVNTTQHLHGRRIRGKRIVFPDELPIDPPVEPPEVVEGPTLATLAAQVENARRELDRIETARAAEGAKAAKRKVVTALKNEYTAAQAALRASEEAERAFLQRIYDEDEFFLLAA